MDGIERLGVVRQSGQNSDRNVSFEQQRSTQDPIKVFKLVIINTKIKLQ